MGTGITKYTIFNNPSDSGFNCKLSTYKFGAEGKTRVNTYTDGDIATEGNNVPEINRYLDSTATSRTQIYVDGNYTAGTLGPKFGFGSGTSGPNRRAAGDSLIDAYHIAPGHNLYFEIENASGSTGDIYFILRWYEKEE